LSDEVSLKIHLLGLERKQNRPRAHARKRVDRSGEKGMIGFKSLRQALMLGVAGFAGATAATAIAQPAFAQEATRTYNIQAQDLNSALREFALQTGRDVLYPPEIVAGKRSNGAQGQLTERQALEALISGSGLRFEQTASGGYAVQDPNSPTRLGDAEAAAPSEEGYAEILVIGQRTLNTDIRRTEDDIQPYVVLDAETIERSQADNINELLRQQLPMNAAQAANNQVAGGDNSSLINLRGLGGGQTLILVDGRRLPGVSAGFDTRQPDINGIPLAAVERIEVLPSTAGGIYGGGATGGVVNIVLKREYSGAELRATYGNTFDTDVGSFRAEFSGGMTLNDGRTRVMATASASTANELLMGDRDFNQRSRDLRLSTDPASLIGGTTPPDGYTANICSANASGRCIATPLVLDDGTPLGSNITFVPLGYPGALTAGDAGHAFLANAGQYNLALPQDLRGLRRSLLNDPDIEAYSLTLRHDFTDNIEGFLSATSTENEAHSSWAGSFPGAITLQADNPFNPFQQRIRVRYPVPNFGVQSTSTTSFLSVTGGALARLPYDWSAALDYSWSRSRAESTTTTRPIDPTALNAGLIDVMLDANQFSYDWDAYLHLQPDTFVGPFDAILTDLTARASGPLFHVPAGRVALTALAERREEITEQGFSEDPLSGLVYHPERSRTVDSLYAEVRVPIASIDHQFPLVRELDLQASIRTDQYETHSTAGFGFSVPSRAGPLPTVTYDASTLESTDYTLGLRYVPIEDLTIRASFGTGFLPPALFQLAQTEDVFLVDDVVFGFGIGLDGDPQRGGEPLVGDASGNITIFGGGVNLRPEESQSWSLGIVLTPRFADGLRVSIDYTEIQKTDEIVEVAGQYFLDHEEQFPGRVIRGPNLPGDPPGTPGPIVGIDLSSINLSETTVGALDIQADYSWQTENFGTFRPFVTATLAETFEYQVLPDTPSVDFVGFSARSAFVGAVGAPLRWRANFGMVWDNGPWELSWNAQYYDRYHVYSPTDDAGTRDTAILRQGSDHIPSQVYHDLLARYRFGGNGPIANAEIALGIQNVLNESPPIVETNGISGLAYSAYGDPRLRRFTLSLRKQF
jgi:iron complex outermembrane recepter protein